MSKAINSLKVSLSQNQFRLSKAQLDGIRHFCIFIDRFYVKLWFSAPVAAMAPSSVLLFLRDVAAFSEISLVVVDVVSKKMSGYL